MPSLTEQAKAFLNQLNASARKKLGQNFMVREEELGFIADALAIEEGETVLEIGPGLGFLTRLLLNKKAQVLAVEKDALYAVFLLKHFAGRPLRLAEKDVLKLDLEKDFGVDAPIKVAGNIPYNITTPILEWLINNRRLIITVVLTVQWELARRLAAEPGGKDWGSLSVFLRLYADVRLLKKISRESFFPSPQVDSAVLRLDFLKAPRFELKDERLFFALVRRSFQKRRKTLLNALTDEATEQFSKPSLGLTLKSAGLDTRRRPETLSLEEWARLSSFFK